MEFKAPWKFVCDYKEKMDSLLATAATKNASEGGAFAEIFSILPPVNGLRTILKENLDAEGS